jgi:hypothetical protein
MPKHYVITYGSEGKTYVIRSLETRRMWVTSLTLRLLFPPGRKRPAPVGYAAGYVSDGMNAVAAKL